jgi:hypothetical protein
MRVFISDAQSWVGKAISASLQASSAGVTRVVGTVRANGAGAGAASSDTPAGFVPVGSVDALRMAADCDVVILSLLSAAREALAVGEAIRSRAADGKDRTIVVVSSALAWDRTPGAAAGVAEDNWLGRRPSPSAAALFSAENALLALGRKGCRVHVVAAGLPFGGDGGPLRTLCQTAWESTGALGKPLPIPTTRTEDGSNGVPTVHVADLSGFVVKIAAASAGGLLEPGPATQFRQPLRYVLACDRGRSSAAGLVNAIAQTLGDGRTALAGPRTLEDPPALSSTAASAAVGDDPSLDNLAMPYLSCDIRVKDIDACAMHGHPLVALGSSWKAQDGFAAAAKRVIAPEFVRAHNLQAVRALVVGPPSSGKSHTASVLAAKYGVPVVTVKSAIAAILAPDVSTLADSDQRRDAIAALRKAVDAYLGAATAAKEAAAKAAEDAAAASAPGKGKAPAKAPEKKGAPTPAQPPEDPYAGANLREPRLPLSLLTRVVRASILSPVCRNKGFVLDGYPRTWREADALFAAPLDGGDGITPVPGEEALGDRHPSLADERDDDEDTLSAAVSAGVPVPGFPTWAPIEGRVPLVINTDGPANIDAAIRPQAVVYVDAADAALRERANAVAAAGSGAPAATGTAPPTTTPAAPGTTPADRFNRRLRRARLHNAPGFERTLPAFFEKNLRIKPVAVKSDAADAGTAGEGAGDASAGASAGAGANASLSDRALVASLVARDVLRMSPADTANAGIVIPEDLPAEAVPPAVPAPVKPRSVARVDLDMLAAACPAIEGALSPPGPPGRFSSSSSSSSSSASAASGRQLTDTEVAAMLAERDKNKGKSADSAPADSGAGAAATEGSAESAPAADDAPREDATGLDEGMEEVEEGEDGEDGDGDDAEAKEDSLSHASRRSGSSATPALEGEKLREVILLEAKLLEKRTTAGRQYLAKTIIPALTSSMVSTVRAVGEDEATGSGIVPLDRLADALYDAATAQQQSRKA